MRLLKTNSLTFKRNTNGRYVSGKYIPGTPIDVPTQGSLQPFEFSTKLAETTKVLLRGLETTSIYTYYTESTLQGTNAFSEKDNDYIELPDGVYEVFSTSNWNIPGVLVKYNVYYLVRRPPPTGGK